MEITVVVPTIRDTKEFQEAWGHLFGKHDVKYVEVQDGEKPTVNGEPIKSKLIYNFSDVVRNAGFLYAKKKWDPDVYITLDDDVVPFGDTIQDHLDTLNMSFPKHWMSTASEYVRGVPYNIRDEMPCMVSHGVWYGVKDWDAPTQLVRGNPEASFYKGHFPKGVYFPFCGMNIAFRKEALPYMYYAPMFDDIQRFGDIWLGRELKKVCDKKNWAIATGYAKVYHERASNVYKNLQREARGIEMNDHYGEDPYFELYTKKREEWEDYVNSL